MITLTYSNRTEALLDRLAERIQGERQSGLDPWRPVQLVVPNAYLKEAVRMGLALRLGVAANLKFNYLDGIWRDLVPADRFRVLTAERMRGGLLAVFGDPALMAQEALGPVRTYLEGDPHGLKGVQLAGELARLFDEYQLSRPDWLDRWRLDAAAAAGDPVGEAWQRQLWRGAVAALDATGTPHRTLVEAILDPALGAQGLPPAVHAFGLSHVAQAYHAVYLRLGGLTELHLYALNPCGEFWEDLTSRSESLWRSRQPRAAARQGPWAEGREEDPYALAQEGPEALRLWGRPGRENIRLLNEVSQCDFGSCFEAPRGAGILARLQTDILLFQDPPAEADGEPDPSVAFHACPSPRREAEVVATEIWRLLEAAAKAGQPLSFSEVAVIVPAAQEEAYLAHLQAAFQETRQIPWVQGDGALPVLKQTLEAAELLLALPGSGLTRAAVLDVLAHPALQRRFGELDVDAWTRWCQALGIVRGADRAAWAGTYLDRDALNWDQGLRRLALGAFMADGVEVEAPGGGSLPLPVADAGSAGRFLTLARALVQDATRLFAARQDLGQWVRELEGFLVTWLQGEDEPSVRAVAELSRHLKRLLEAAPEGLPLPALGYTAMAHLAAEALERLRGEHPSSLLKGVVVSSYAPMRAIPFRAVFLMGLGEGIFPAKEVRNPLDLRANARRPGDVSQAEKEKYLFLETLLSAREHLCLSYVAKDELTGERQEPSGLFQEFRALAGRYLGPAFAPEGERDPLVVNHPLRRFDPAYFAPWFPEAGEPGRVSYSQIAQDEARALWLGRDLRRGQPPLAMPRALGDLPAHGAALGALLAHPGAGLAPPLAATLQLSLSDLRRWLECPLSGAAAQRLGLRLDPLEDLAAVADEPFESDALTGHGLRQEVAFEAARGLDLDPAALYDARLQRLQCRGEAPFGLFAQGEREANLALIRPWVEGLRAQDEPLETWRVGPSRSARSQADHAEPAIALSVRVQGRDQRLELTGELLPQLGNGSVFLERKAGAAADFRKKALRAYLDHLVLACVQPGHEEHLARFFHPAGQSQFRFAAVTETQARAILAAWAGDLLAETAPVLLPLEAVLEAFQDQEPLTAEGIREFVDQELDGLKLPGRRISLAYGPVPDPARYAPPADPQGLVDRRFGAFLAQVQTFVKAGPA